MGWISDRHMRDGGSMGTGPEKGIGRYPLRKIVRVLGHARTMFDTDYVELECGHKVQAYGMTRARCRQCPPAGGEE